MEDPQVVKAMSGDGQDEVVKRFEQLALDSAGLAAELHIVAAAKLEELIGHSQSELTGMLKTIDPATIQDPREREKLEAIQALGEIELPYVGRGRSQRQWSWNLILSVLHLIVSPNCFGEVGVLSLLFLLKRPRRIVY